MGEVRQTQGIGNNIQLEFIQMGQQILRKNQRICCRIVVFVAQTVAFAPDEAGVVQKVYYNENVYRVSKDTQAFKEIMQTGLECIGDIAFDEVFEKGVISAVDYESTIDRDDRINRDKSIREWNRKADDIVEFLDNNKENIYKRQPNYCC